ncbi:ubiquinol-cytochrome c reductase subunit 7 [Blastomyces parvus]|uniref:Complex III subunit 7 n=1 Tax=Blastomyces parvus TaxID=2060905 RepID=A0A2B7WGX4_9EURO|nr:ubiquinol-cytochrome c reductase subunit 7 [Blastomyces parvus]
MSPPATVAALGGRSRFRKRLRSRDHDGQFRRDGPSAGVFPQPAARLLSLLEPHLHRQPSIASKQQPATCPRRPLRCSDTDNTLVDCPSRLYTMSAPSLLKQINARPWLKRMMMPLANWHANASGYRQMGLRADDLIPEENDTVQLALRRLPPKEAYDRVFRIRRAFQLSIEHQLLPAEQQTKPEEDVEYLSPIIREIERENKERADLDNLVIKR